MERNNYRLRFSWFVYSHLLIFVILLIVSGLGLKVAVIPAIATTTFTIEHLNTYEGYWGVRNVQIVGNFAYVTLNDYEREKPVSGLGILDVSDPHAPIQIGRYDTTIPGLPTSLQVVDSLAYITSFHQDGGLHILDVREPAKPTLRGNYKIEGSVWDVSVANTTAYVTSNTTRNGRPMGSLQILDVHNPANPTLVGRFETDQFVNKVQISGQFAYIASLYSENTGEGGLQIVDVSNPAAPMLVGSYEMYSADDLQVIGSLVYIGFVNARGGGGLSIIDVGDPVAPKRIGGVGIPTHRVQIEGNRAFIAPSDVALGSGLYIVTISNLFDPDFFYDNTSFGVEEVFVTGELVYIVERGTLSILRVRQNSDEHPSSTTQPSSTAHCFSETNFCIDGRIREYWEQNGGLPVFGYPITEQRVESIEGKDIEVQWFERNRLELHPENAPPYDVLLGRLGVEGLEQQGRDWQTEFARSEPQEGCRYFEVTGQNVCGDMLTAWQAYGVELGDPGIAEGESLALFGLPISPLHEEAIEGQPYQVQWFERARFEYHPENEPPYTVLLGLLGSEWQDER